MDTVKKGLSLSKQYGVGAKLSNVSDPRVAMAGKLLTMAGGGMMDTVKKGLALSNKYGVGAKLSSMSDPRVAMAGKLLSMAGGGRRRYYKHLYVSAAKKRR